MDFYIELQQIDKTKKNIAITVLTGKNMGNKILLSDGEIIFTSNEDYDWERIISCIPEIKKSQVICVDNEKIYVEFIRKSCNVVVCGAGHISISIVKMCKLLDMPVTVIDDRLSFINDAVRAGADKSICEPFEKVLESIEGDKETFFIIVTRGHRYDQVCLENIIKKDNI